MKNLAGQLCDATISEELSLVRIPQELVPRVDGEVRYSVVGKLGGFTFTRAWRYWIVKGKLPLSIAEELYADPIGAKDVRVAGHCACPAPISFAVYYDADGVKLCNDPSGANELAYRTLLEQHPDWRASARPLRFVPDAEAVAANAFVESYHIDSLAGLRLFADTLRKHGLGQ